MIRSIITVFISCYSLFNFISCKKIECVEVVPVDVVANKIPFHRDSFFTLEVPLQAGLSEEDYSWLRPNKSRITGSKLNIEYLTPEDEGLYVLTIGKQGCSVETEEYNLGFSFPPLGCSLDSNKLSITGSTTITFTNIDYDVNSSTLSAENGFASLWFEFDSDLTSKPKEGIYFFGNANNSTSVYGRLNYGSNQWLFRDGTLQVFNRNNKLSIKCCAQPILETQNGFETTAKLWITEQ